MMIIKFLPTSSNFPAIEYNDKKTLEGKSELLEVGNFEGLGHVREELGRSDYINYIQAVAELNDRVRNKQFHAVISTRGRSHTPVALKDIALQYLEKMGFGNSPYLIYVHTDTDNTHVHMVSSWVGKQGKRVDDSYAWLKSCDIMHEILQQSPRQEAREAIAKALGYNFSSVAQFNLLLYQEGFKTRERPTGLQVIKYGRVVGTFETKQVIEKVHAYVSPENRISQLKELFYTFMPGLSLKGFTGFMQKQFGIDVILHPWKKNGLSGDYSIIDHGGGHVFRGEQVMAAEELKSAVTRGEKLAKAKKYILEMTGENTPFSVLRKEMTALGFEVNRDGTIRVKGTTAPTLQVTRERLKGLQYNDRLASANKYVRAGSKEAELLARLFMVRPYELSSSQRKVDPAKYDALFENIDPRKTEDILTSLSIMLIKYSANFFLIDEKEKAVVMIGGEKVAGARLCNTEIPDLDRRGNLPENSYRHLECFEYQGADTLGKVIEAVRQSSPDKTRMIGLSL